MSDAVEIPYSRLDRALHRLAFGALDVQRALGGLESRLFKDRIAAARAERPVFVTALPRAGTTMILEALARQPEFASATYRQMPFALCPLLWEKLSGGVRRRSDLSERAHGDGVQVGFDSPEAFEEILWRAWWPDRYEDGRIGLWAARDRDPEFEDAFRVHTAKIVAASGGSARRYLSKNNANVARIDLLTRIFPDATIVIPIRHPFAQAASLLRQHLRFEKVHAEEPFARDYMTWLGHFEFGAALKPIDFGGWTSKRSETTDDFALRAEDLTFWIEYWSATMEHLLKWPRGHLVFIDFDRLCETPGPCLRSLAGALGLNDPEALTDQATGFHAQPQPPSPDVAPAIASRALDLHATAAARSLNSA